MSSHEGNKGNKSKKKDINRHRSIPISQQKQKQQQQQILTDDSGGQYHQEYDNNSNNTASQLLSTTTTTSTGTNNRDNLSPEPSTTSGTSSAMMDTSGGRRRRRRQSDHSSTTMSVTDVSSVVARYREQVRNQENDMRAKKQAIADKNRNYNSNDDKKQWIARDQSSIYSEHESSIDTSRRDRDRKVDNNQSNDYGDGGGGDEEHHMPQQSSINTNNTTIHDHDSAVRQWAALLNPTTPATNNNNSNNNINNSNSYMNSRSPYTILPLLAGATGGNNSINRTSIGPSNDTATTRALLEVAIRQGSASNSQQLHQQQHHHPKQAPQQQTQQQSQLFGSGLYDSCTIEPDGSLVFKPKIGISSSAVSSLSSPTITAGINAKSTTDSRNRTATFGLSAQELRGIAALAQIQYDKQQQEDNNHRLIQEDNHRLLQKLQREQQQQQQRQLLQQASPVSHWFSVVNNILLANHNQPPMPPSTSAVSAAALATLLHSNSLSSLLSASSSNMNSIPQSDQQIIDLIASLAAARTESDDNRRRQQHGVNHDNYDRVGHVDNTALIDLTATDDDDEEKARGNIIAKHASDSDDPSVVGGDGDNYMSHNRAEKLNPRDGIKRERDLDVSTRSSQELRQSSVAGGKRSISPKHTIDDNSRSSLSKLRKDYDSFRTETNNNPYKQAGIVGVSEELLAAAGKGSTSEKSGVAVLGKMSSQLATKGSLYSFPSPPSDQNRTSHRDVLSAKTSKRTSDVPDHGFRATTPGLLGDSKKDLYKSSKKRRIQEIDVKTNEHLSTKSATNFANNLQSMQEKVRMLSNMLLRKVEFTRFDTNVVELSHHDLEEISKNVKATVLEDVRNSTSLKNDTFLDKGDDITNRDKMAGRIGTGNPEFAHKLTSLKKLSLRNSKDMQIIRENDFARYQERKHGLKNEIDANKQTLKRQNDSIRELQKLVSNVNTHKAETAAARKYEDELEFLQRRINEVKEHRQFLNDIRTKKCKLDSLSHSLNDTEPSGVKRGNEQKVIHVDDYDEKILESKKIIKDLKEQLIKEKSRVETSLRTYMRASIRSLDALRTDALSKAKQID